MTRRRLVVVLGVLIGLTIWGPPSLYTRARALDAALATPFAFDPGALFRVGTWALAGVCIALMLCGHVLRRRPSVLARFIRVPAWAAYLLFGVVGLLSALWSVAPVYTLYFAAQVVVVCLLVAVFVDCSGSAALPRLLRIVFITHVLWMLVTVVVYAISPALVSAGSGVGTVRLHGGMLGGYGAPGAVASVFFLSAVLFPRSNRHRAWSGAGLLAAWLFLVAAQTRATIAAALLCGLLLCLVRLRVGARVLLALSTAGVAVALVPLALTRRALDLASREGEGLDTLSGRTVAWDHLMSVWQESPWIGFGFAAGTRDALVDFYDRTGLNIGAGHDVLSTMLVDIGVVGAVVVGVALLAAWVQFVSVLQATRAAEHRLMAVQLGCLLLLVTISGVTGQGIAKASVLFVIAALGLGLLREQLLTGAGPRGPVGVRSRHEEATRSVSGGRRADVLLGRR